MKCPICYYEYEYLWTHLSVDHVPEDLASCIMKTVYPCNKEDIQK